MRYFLFSLNKAIRRFNKDPNNQKYIDDLAKMLSGRNKNSNISDFTHGGYRFDKSKQTFVYKDSEEMANDYISRISKIKHLVDSGKLNPKAMSVLPDIKYKDEYGNIVTLHTNSDRDRSNITKNEVYLRHPERKFHEANGHLNPLLKSYRFSPKTLSTLRKYNSHATEELQKLEGVTDVIGMEAHNRWVKQKRMNKSFLWSPQTLYDYRNKDLVSKRQNLKFAYDKTQANSNEHKVVVDKIYRYLPLDLRNPYGLQYFLTSSADKLLENTEPYLAQMLKRAQNTGESGKELFESVNNTYNGRI